MLPLLRALDGPCVGPGLDAGDAEHADALYIRHAQAHALPRVEIKCRGASLHGPIMTSTPSTQRLLDGVAVSIPQVPLDEASTAASSSRNDLVKNYRVHPTYWLISTQGGTG